jgi:hypothetical protein
MDNTSIKRRHHHECLQHRQRTKNQDQFAITQHNGQSLLASKRSSSRTVSFKQRTFALYANGISDWDSTDSEQGIDETKASYSEPEICQTRS